MDRGSFLYAADGQLLVRSNGNAVRPASRHEWAAAALAMNPALDNPHVMRFVPDFVQQLLLPPGERDA
jgi:hypothetical protein